MELIKIKTTLSKKSMKELKRLAGIADDSSQDAFILQVEKDGSAHGLYLPNDQAKQVRKVLIPLFKKAKWLTTH